MLNACIFTMGFKPFDYRLIRRLVGVTLVCFTLLDINVITEAASVSQIVDVPRFSKLSTAAVEDRGSMIALIQLLLQPSGHRGINQKIRGIKPSDHPTPTNSAKGIEPNVRSKRWDFKMDGCHCHGYNIECIHDSTCQRRHRSRQWKCSHTCCGFQCISYIRQYQNSTHQHLNSTRQHLNSTHQHLNSTRQHLNSTRPPRNFTHISLNSTSTAYNSTRTSHSSLRIAFGSRPIAHSSTSNHKNSTGMVEITAQLTSIHTRSAQRQVNDEDGGVDNNGKDESNDSGGSDED